MLAANSSSSYKLRSLVTLLHHYYGFRYFAPSHQGLYGVAPSPNRGYGLSMNHGLRLISGGTGAFRKTQMDMAKTEANKGSSQGQTPHKYSVFTWAKWIFGSAISVLASLWKQRWDSIQTIEGKVEEIVEEVEDVAEIVEKVATMAETVLANVENNLPENSKLKEAAEIAEHVASVAAKDAELTIDVIQKVDDLKKDVKDLQTLVEPVIDKIVEAQFSKN